MLVSVWQRGSRYRAFIIDPVREVIHTTMEAESEIDVSVSDDNRIILATYSVTDGTAGVSREIAWP